MEAVQNNISFRVQSSGQSGQPLKKHLKIALVEVKPLKNEYIAKEMAGGLGKRIRLGGGIFSSVLNKYLTTMFNAPPVILANVAGVCNQFQHEVTAYHTSNACDVDRSADIAVVLSSMVDYHNELNFIEQLKAVFPNIKVIVVGSFASAMPEVYSSRADCIITGDPEAALQKIFKEGFSDEKVIHSERPDNLNELPMLDWTPSIKNGSYATRPFSKEKVVSIQKSRGCSM